MPEFLDVDRNFKALHEVLFGLTANPNTRNVVFVEHMLCYKANAGEQGVCLCVYMCLCVLCVCCCCCCLLDIPTIKAVELEFTT